MRIALTIAGSDPSGGAGLQADLKTFHQFDLYGAAVPTLLTVQNTRGVQAVSPVESELVAAQLHSVLDDLTPDAAKTGALGSAGVVEVVADRLGRASFPVVVDPIFASHRGVPLLDRVAVEQVRNRLLPRAALVTPNLHEASILSGIEVTDLASMNEAARRIVGLGAAAVLVTGGHLEGDEVADLLFADGESRTLVARRVATRATHGTGCTLSAAITALLARGDPLLEAVTRAKRYVTRAIEEHPGLGDGDGPVNHHASTD